MNPQDLTHLKEQYIEMRLRDRPYQSLLEKTEPTIPQWLIEEDTNSGHFVLGGDRKKGLRMQRFTEKWRHLIPCTEMRNGWYLINYNGEKCVFSPSFNSIYTMRGTSDSVYIQPALHLLIKGMY